MNQTETILRRAVEGIRIPSGETVSLAEGQPVLITQSLGGSFTVATDTGLFRIVADDADALGFEKPARQDAAALTEMADEKAVWDALKTCYDPEIPVNIVDLGLVYDCRVEDGVVSVKMTLTAPGCGMGPTLCAEAQSKIMALPGVASADVQLVWDPPWNQGMISEVGRMQLGLV